jgi:hypothetical protein
MKAVELCKVCFASLSNLKLMRIEFVKFKYPNDGQTVVNMSQCGFE